MPKGTFARAYAGLNLTPFERAALRLLEGVAISVLMAGTIAVLPLLSGGASVDWSRVGHVFLAAGSTALALAILKYARAFGDPPITPPTPLPPTGA